MGRRKKFSIAAGLLVGLSFCFALLSWAAAGGTVSLVTGWNLLGNSSSTSLDVAATFGDAAKVTTVWKWIPAKSNWAFYTPIQSDGGAAYAAGKGYDLLTSVGSGEGFWVNAKVPFTAQLPAGTSLTSASFRGTLLSGWNLIATGDSKTPSQFNQALSTTPPAIGSTPLNLITLWSWDAPLANWFFYAPSLEASSALSNYIASKGYLDYGTRAIDPATGFWVNRSAPPASIDLGSTSVTSALPMSILTLNGTGFDTTATTSVRFFDANQYSVDVRPIRVSGTAIAVAVPPYFNSTSAVFAPGTVSVKVIQTSGAGTRTSGAIAGFQILDLPNAAGPAGAVTLNLLQSLQAEATALQTSITGTALDSPALRSSLAGQASALAPLITAVQSVVQDASLRVSLGGAADMGAAELRQADRLLLGMFLALGGDSSGLASASGTAIAKSVDRPLGAALTSALDATPRRNAPVQLAYSGALGQLAISFLANGLLDGSGVGASNNGSRNEIIQLAQAASSGGCMQAESNAYTQCIAQGTDARECNNYSMVSAPRSSTLCSAPGAFNTAFAVVGAGLVAGIGITALVFGASVGTVAGTAGVLALGGYLAYATVATGLAQIGIGGTLGQSTPGARELVVGGLKQLNDFVRDTTISLGVGAALGETAQYVNDALTAAKNLGDALEQTVIPASTTTTTPTTSTTTTTSSSSTPTTTTSTTSTPTTTTTVSTTTTSTVATAYCACRFDVYSTAFGPGGAWVCQNTNIWYLDGGYLMDYGACACDPNFYQVCQ